MKIDSHFHLSEWQRCERLTKVIVGKCMSQNKGILILVDGSVLIGYERIRGTKEQKRQWTKWALVPSLHLEG